MLALTVIAVAVAVAVVAALAVVVAAIRLEPRGAESGTWAPSPLAAMVRRLTGLHVRRPDDEGW